MSSKEPQRSWGIPQPPLWSLAGGWWKRLERKSVTTARKMAESKIQDPSGTGKVIGAWVVAGCRTVMRPPATSREGTRPG